MKKLKELDNSMSSLASRVCVMLGRKKKPPTIFSPHIALRLAKTMFHERYLIDVFYSKRRLFPP